MFGSGVQVDCIEEADGRGTVSAWQTAMCCPPKVVVGIGIIPAVEPLLAVCAAGG
jgi:hypothetical protein